MNNAKTPSKESPMILDDQGLSKDYTLYYQKVSKNKRHFFERLIKLNDQTEWRWFWEGVVLSGAIPGLGSFD